MMNGKPCPARALASSDRMLDRVSNDVGAYGLVASHCRSQLRLSSSDRSRLRASRSRIGRMLTRPSLRDGTAIATDSPSRAPGKAEVRRRTPTLAGRVGDRRYRLGGHFVDDFLGP